MGARMEAQSCQDAAAGPGEQRLIPSLTGTAQGICGKLSHTHCPHTVIPIWKFNAEWLSQVTHRRIPDAGPRSLPLALPALSALLAVQNPGA